MRLLAKAIQAIHVSLYLRSFKKQINDTLFLLDTNTDNAEHIRSLLKEINRYCPQIKCYLCVEKENYNIIFSVLKEENILNTTLIKKRTFLYYKILAYSKYLYNDSSFPPMFKKRDGQIYLFDAFTLCKDKNIDYTVEPDFSLFNHSSSIQNNLLWSDYILCNNSIEKDNLERFYFLDKLYNGEFLIKDKKNNEDYYSSVVSLISAVKKAAKKNKKDNILIFCSDLRRNGMTTSLINLLSLINLDDANYILTYPEEMFFSYPERLNALPKKACLLPVNSEFVKKTLLEIFLHSLYFRFNMNTPFIYKRVFAMYKRAYEKCYGFINFRTVIHFTGYSPEFSLLFMKPDAKRIIFAHNDMYEEYAEKKNFHMPTLIHAYKNYDTVACVSNAVKESLLKLNIDPSNPAVNNVTVLENAHDHIGVVNKSTEPFLMDSDTFISISLEGLKSVLSSDKKKFISIGRFSKEKGHIKLMDAFSKFHEEFNDTVLIIIGGYGPFFEETAAYKNKLTCSESIIIIKSIINPFAILKYCDLFILPSDREPLGLVLLEADSLGIPIIATDIPGSGDFMKQYNGYLVENSINGLVEGMYAFTQGKVKSLSVNYEKYNSRIVEQFEELCFKK